MKFIAPILLLCAAMTASTSASSGEGGLRRPADRELAEYTHKVTITATNLAPQFGTCQSPVWVAIHDGRFDMFNQGRRAADGVEAMAEDGNPAPFSEQFAVTRGTVWEGNIGDGRFCSGETATLVDYLNIPTGASHFLSYATMVLPSNDAFLANASPRAYKVTNNNARPVQTVVTAVDLGSEVWDAGTEINDEIPRNTGGLAQMGPNVGVNEWWKIMPHPGFNPKGSGGILDMDAYRNADFKKPGYQMMKLDIKVEMISSNVKMHTSDMDMP